MQRSITKIALAGAGNLAWHLAKGLKLQGFQVSAIWSRNYLHAQELADSCRSVACKNISELRNESELIIIAVADKAIEQVASSIGAFDGIVAHSAGSVPMSVLHESFSNYGVIYPLQTFSKDIDITLDHVPFFLEASSAEVMVSLRQVASELSDHVYETESDKRLLLHAAAVFAGNYSNLMYSLGNEILKSANIPQDVLRNLITETARKAVNHDPYNMQTGPARRKDSVTIKKHIEALATLPEYAEIYRLLANLISNKYE
jgi:predicted short-subunit dehydrogenase-like oxidoreductase (DUF2520 family)